MLLSAILEYSWKQGRDLDLAALIQQIQTPPVQRLGVMDVDSFFPAKERFALAMRINNLLASPGFGAWLEGEPLDIARFLHTPEGKPRVSIFSIAHLADSERMFFVSLLLNSVLSWMRAQPGTSSLRAILYMDEIFGYFPPVANPPSKMPLLTLLKQARAFGWVWFLPPRIRLTSTTRDSRTPARGSSDGCKPSGIRRVSSKDWKVRRRARVQASTAAVWTLYSPLSANGSFCLITSMRTNL